MLPLRFTWLKLDWPNFFRFLFFAKYLLLSMLAAACHEYNTIQYRTFVFAWLIVIYIIGGGLPGYKSEERWAQAHLVLECDIAKANLLYLWLKHWSRQLPSWLLCFNPPRKRNGARLLEDDFTNSTTMFCCQCCCWAMTRHG